jgi:cytochrome c553
MANKSKSEHATTTPGEPESAHEHAGSSVGFYIFIALVLGVITYVEFALIEYQETWFSFMGGTSILIWLIVLSVVKFILVVMFFMHLKDDDRTFTGFFTSGMVIAVGTLIALSALFTVRSLATAQTPQQEQSGTTAGAGAETGTHGEGHERAVPEPSLAHRFEYPPPKTLDDDAINLTPPGQLTVGGSVEDSGGYPYAQDAATEGGSDYEVLQESSVDGRIAAGIPLAAPPAPITLPDPFSEQIQQEPAPAAQPTGDASQAPAAAASGDPAAGEALFVGALGCVGCHGEGGAGGVGPSLTDSEWIYGGDEASLTETLVNGRPGGMPAFGAQASEEDIANVVAYIMSLSGGQGSGE